MSKTGSISCTSLTCFVAVGLHLLANSGSLDQGLVAQYDFEGKPSNSLNSNEFISGNEEARYARDHSDKTMGALDPMPASNYSSPLIKLKTAAFQFSNLVAFYSLDGHFDDSVSGAQGRKVGDVANTKGKDEKQNTALAFNGGGYIDLQNSELLNGKNEASITGWIKVNQSTASGFVIGAGDSRSGLDPFTLKISTDPAGSVVVSESLFTQSSRGPNHPQRAVGFNRSGDPSMEKPVARFIPLDLHEWHFFCMQFRSAGGSTRYRFILDGEPIVDEAFNYSHSIAFDRPMPIQIGALTGFTDTYLTGAHLDEISFYDRYLTDSEISALYYQDSDQDGLVDDLEITVFKTNPNEPDTDGDGLSDGEEIGIDRYQIVEGDFTWKEALEDANARSGHLLTVSSEEEWRAVVNLIGDNFHQKRYFMGGSDEAKEGVWGWHTGEPWSYERWYDGEPNNLVNEDFLVTWIDDGWNDTHESIRHGYILETGEFSNPLKRDTDEDGISDRDEVVQFNTFPSISDSDSDGLSDGEEILLGYNPRDSESRPLILTQPKGGTFQIGTSPSLSVGLQDGMATPFFQWFKDEIPLIGENSKSLELDSIDFASAGSYTVSVVASGRSELSQPAIVRVIDPDTDGDGLTDWEERKIGTNPILSDSDSDGISDSVEVRSTRTDPLLVDSDADGFSDGKEVQKGTDPNSPSSYPIAEGTLRIDWEPIGALRISAYTEDGATYRLVRSRLLVTFVDTGVEIKGTGGWVDYIFEPSEGANYRFYKVERVDQ